MSELNGRREPRIIFQTAPALEAAFALQALLHHNERPFATGWAETLREKLSDAEVRHLQLLQQLPDVFWLGDLAVRRRIFHDPGELVACLNDMTEVEQSQAMFDPDLPLAEVAKWRQHPQGAARLLGDRPWLWGGNAETVALCLDRPGDVAAAAAALLQRVWQEGVMPMLPELERLWTATMAQAETEAAGLAAAEFALKVFGTHFGRRYGPDHRWQVHMFVPSYFVSPLRVAMFDPELAVLTLDARLGPWLVHETRGRIARGMQALTDENRLGILRLLRHRPGYGAWIAARHKLKPATVTHHLAVLREAGLVQEVDAPPGAMPGAAKYFKTDLAAVDELLSLVRDYVNDVIEPERQGDPHGTGHSR